ncbi:MAG: DUF452 family protein [Mangrovicoccus sp.]|nr:DUF452 family protein [Mangrovicoccus sp.]
MRAQWLSRAGSDRLLLVFGGWGLGPAPFKELTGAQDVLFVQDYTTLEDPLAARGDYDQITLLAYSFGVVSAAHWLTYHPCRPDRLVAVNGTLYPADEQRGIAPKIAQGTVDGLSPQSFAGFCRRAGLRGALPDCDIAAAQQELAAILARGPAPDRGFDRIWISERDRIVPAAAQRKAWARQAEAIREIPGGTHCPFGPGQSWQEWLA